MFVEQSSDPGRPFVLLPVPGFEIFATVGEGPIRGMFQSDGVLSNKLYVISGAEVFVVTEADEVRSIMHGHSEGLLCGLAAHPTEDCVLSGSDDGTVRLWSLEDHELLQTTITPAGCRCVDFSHDGTYVAAGLTSGEVFLYQVGDKSNPYSLVLQQRD